MSKRRPQQAKKDVNSFMEALKLNEDKHYKKSLKLTEAILKKNHNNAEALALKALNLHFLKEAHESELYINKSIEKDPFHPTANHILGILRRVQLRYVEAAKFFKQALDAGSANKQIWRDLSVMELQNRDYKSVQKSRHAYLEEFLGFRANWTGLAVAHFLNGDFDAAERTLTKFEDLAKGKLSEAEAFEHSELQLFKNHVIAEQSVERALKDLDEIDTFDKLDELELRGKYLLKTGEYNKAAKVYRTLLKRNPDDIRYYSFLEISLKTFTKSEKFRDSLYQKLQKFYPKSDAPKFIPLTFTSGDLFKKRAEDYILGQLKRGVPATFTNVKPLYKDPSKAAIIEEIVLKFANAELDPLIHVWTLYFLAQNYLQLKDLAKAKEYIDAAIKHTPTLVELYIMKARILKHYGDFESAAQVMNEGRLIDLQDRFINSKTVKYYLRANEIEKATEVVSLFTKNDDSINGVKDLHTMQASWFLIENAESYLRLYQEAVAKKDSEAAVRNGGLALKRFKAIVKVFEEYYNDQLDFHTFCMRRGTARAYIEMLTWEDRIYTSPVYVRAVAGASKILLGDKLAKEEEDKSKKKDKNRFKILEEERKKVLAYTDDDDVFGAELYDAEWLPLFAEFFDHLIKQGGDLISTNDLQFHYQFKLNKVALALAALGKLKKATSDQYEFIPAYLLTLKTKTEGFSRVLAEKGIEKNFPGLEVEFDSLVKKYLKLDEFKSLLGYAKLLNLGLGDKTVLLEHLQKLEPTEQFQVLNELTK